MLSNSFSCKLFTTKRQIFHNYVSSWLALYLYDSLQEYSGDVVYETSLHVWIIDEFQKFTYDDAT